MRLGRWSIHLKANELTTLPGDVVVGVQYLPALPG
jgi:hypothetical protein